ncbi:unnamed protein product [Arctogadus glacialis]
MHVWTLVAYSSVCEGASLPGLRWALRPEKQMISLFRQTANQSDPQEFQTRPAPVALMTSPFCLPHPPLPHHHHHHHHQHHQSCRQHQHSPPIQPEPSVAQHPEQWVEAWRSVHMQGIREAGSVRFTPGAPFPSFRGQNGMGGQG